MSTDKPESLAIDGEGLRVGIVAARYNFQMVNALLESVLQTLDASGVREQDMETFRVPGSNEIPYAAAMAARSGEFDVIITLGVVIAGDTDHHAIIGESTAHALHRVAINFELPVINGILTVESTDQARERITGRHKRGVEYAHAALEMAQLGHMFEKRILDAEEAFGLDDLDWLEELEDEDPEDWKQ